MHDMTPTQHKVIGTALAQNLPFLCNSTIRTHDMLGSAQLVLWLHKDLPQCLVWLHSHADVHFF